MSELQPIDRESIALDTIKGELLAHDTAQVLGTGPLYSRLTVDDVSLILRYHGDGLSQTEIAQRLGKHQTSIGRVIRKLGSDSSDIAKALFRARAYRSAVRVTRIAEKGRPEDALKAAKVVLAASGVIEGVSAINLGVQVIIGTPQQAALDASSITVMSGQGMTGASLSGPVDAHNQGDGR